MSFNTYDEEELLLSDPGAFLALLQRSGPWWKKLSGSGVPDKAVDDALEPVLNSYAASLARDAAGHVATSATSALPPSAAAALLQPAKFIFPAAGVAVRPAVTPIEGALMHVSPYVMQDSATQRIIVFSGHISNLADLAGSDVDDDDDGDGDDEDDGQDHVMGGVGFNPDEDEGEGTLTASVASWAGADPDSSSAHHLHLHPPQHLSVSPSAAAAAAGQDRGCVGVGGGVGVGGTGDKVARLTTGTLLQLYDKLGAGKELLMLSELQGEFAFVILDANKKVSFAARDPSGEEELFFCVAGDGSLMYTNSLAELTPDMAKQPWQTVPPGYYVAGKEPMLMQYALTSEQMLQQRDRHQSLEELDDMLDACVLATSAGTAGGGGGGGGAFGHSSSLDRGHSAGQHSAGSDSLEERSSPAANFFKRLSRPFL